MNKNELLAVMARYGDSGGKLADYLEMSHQTFSSKINEKSPQGFTQPEILKIKERYELSAIDIELIFFNKKVS